MAESPAQRWSELEGIIDQALDLAPDLRSSFLTERCSGDQDLKAEAEQLLRAAEAADFFLDQPGPAYAAPLVARVAEGQPLATGTMLGAYEVVRRLGRGGTATVYLARDAKHRRSVAIKVLHPWLATSLGSERFLREIELAATLHHPHILPLFDSGDAEGLLYYVMPHVEGESLRQRLGQEKRLTITDAIRVVREVAGALDYAHRRGFVHRDIKPENILLQDGQALVGDFGIARAINDAAVANTDSDRGTGTPAYMSPEQADPAAVVDGRSDLYALGCVFYEMLTGEPPFTGRSGQEILARHVSDQVPSITTFRPEVPADIDRLLTRALAKRAADRFSTAGELGTALEGSLLADAAPILLRTSARALPRRSLVVAGLVALCGAALFAAHRTARSSLPVAYVPERILVAPLETQEDGAPNALAQQWLNDLPEAIAREGVGEPVAASTVRDLLSRFHGLRSERADHLARETRSGLQLRGTCSRGGAAGGTCEVDLLRMPGKTLRLALEMAGDPRQAAFRANLIERVLVALYEQHRYGDRVRWQGEYIPHSLAAVRSYTDGNVGRAAQLDPDWAEAVARATDDSIQGVAESLLSALGRRPDLPPGEREAVAFQLAIRRREAEQAYRLARSRFQVNPLSWFSTLEQWAMRTGRVHEALAMSEYQDSALAILGGPPDPVVYLYRGYALHQLGRYPEELQLAREIERRFPDLSDVAHTQEVLALAGLGEVDSLRHQLAHWEGMPENAKGGWAGSRAYAAGVELMAHGHRAEGLAILEGTIPFYRRLRRIEGYSTSEVIVLDWTGHFDEARRLGLAALRARPAAWDSLDYIGYLADISVQQGRRAEVARYDNLLAAAARDPELAPEATFLRATIAGRDGNEPMAVWLLEQARALGSKMTLHVMTHREPALANLMSYPSFRRFLAPRD